MQELLKVSNPDDDAYIQALEAVNKLNEVCPTRKPLVVTLLASGARMCDEIRLFLIGC